MSRRRRRSSSNRSSSRRTMTIRKVRGKGGEETLRGTVRRRRRWKYV